MALLSCAAHLYCERRGRAADTGRRIQPHNGYTSVDFGDTCLAARLAVCALFGSFKACCAAPTKLLFPEFAAVFPLLTTVLVPACASFLRPDVLHAYLL